MPPASVKQLLRQAKSAIDEKDFDSALKLCREILKADKQNYHAFVFVGVATAAHGDVGRAVQAYQRAIKLRPTLSLAYKGLIDALSESTEAEHRLISARAHLELCRVAPQYADKSIPAAANMLYRLATEDSTLTSEAVDALRASQHHNTTLPHENIAETTYRIARLLLRSHEIQADEEGDIKRALKTSPLSEALDEYEKLLTCSPRPPPEVDVSRFVVRRAMLRCLRGDEFESNLNVLRKANAYETALEVAELDIAATVNPSERALLAMRHMHLYPFGNTATRSKYIFAAELFSKTRGLEVASRISRVDARVTTTHTGQAAKQLVSSCTQAVVNAFFHLLRQEYKLASLVASEGKAIAATTDGRRRCDAFFNLLKAAAFCGDRKYKESLKYYNEARLYGQREGHSWIENASHQGIVKTSVLAYGRRSRQASTAVEEAAGCSSSMFGLLECAWTDALAGDIDLVRMEELVEQAAERVRLHDVTPGSLEWESSIMDSTFVKSVQEIAATNKTRLGQTIIRDTGATTEGLVRAKRHQMEAATIFKGLPDPFAQLGYILEQLSERNDDDKMLSRATRCYEKAISFDPAHSVAGPRLTQLLLRQGQRRSASQIAQFASEKDPKARWAHNVTGWVRLLDGRPIEAAVSFRNALRGRPKLSSKQEEATFGTNVGQTEDDNLLVTDVDSWRGLSAAYKKMGKLGPAVACLDDALALAQDPPNIYVTSTSADLCAIQKGLRLVLDAEKALMLLSQRNTRVIATAMESLRSSVVSLPLIQYSLSDAFIELAAEQWMKGCYSRATRLRQKAAQLMENSIRSLAERHPQQNASCLLKRLGDVLMEVVTHNPSALANLVGITLIDTELENAITAYVRALHLSPWESQEGVQDIVAAISRKLQAKQDSELASCAVHIAAASKLDPTLTTISLLEAGAIKHGNLRNPAHSIARRMSISSHSNTAAIELSAAISCHGSKGDVGSVVDSAVKAVRQNPVDWRGWYAVGKVRERDAKEKKWPQPITKSCEEAFSEADRLGGGPAAVAGRVRCALSIVGMLSEETMEDTEIAFSQACLCASNAARIGIGEPSTCSDLINRHREKIESKGRDLFRNVSGGNLLDLQRNLHVFPFLDEAVGAFRPAIGQIT